MSLNELLFGALPYAAFALLIVVTIVRWRRHPFSVTSLSSQLLESKKLYWGTLSFHWGLSLILVGHLLALLVPRGLEAWNGEPLRLYLLEITGLALGFWAAFGLVVLIYRRLSDRRVRRVTTPMDLVVLAILGIQILTGLSTAVGYRWGSYWGTAIAVPYMRGLLTFRPDPALVEPLPWMVKAHILTFFVFVAVFPFSRLVHMLTLPLQYLFRPWQRVVATGHTPSRRHRPPQVLGGSSMPQQRSRT